MKNFHEKYKCFNLKEMLRNGYETVMKANKD